MAPARRRRRRRVVVTAGPTHEPIDPVRYLANRSSGRMGFEIARAAAAQGDEVVLVAGPVALETPPGVRRVDVESAREMLRAVREAYRAADALFMAAAVADWRPKRKLAGKWRKKDDGSDVAFLELVRNPDILATVAARRGDRLAVGFALETADGMRRARRKLMKKGVDFVVLNDESVLGSDRTSVTVLGRDESVVRLEDRSKRAVARTLARLERPDTLGRGPAGS